MSAPSYEFPIDDGEPINGPYIAPVPDGEMVFSSEVLSSEQTLINILHGLREGLIDISKADRETTVGRLGNWALSLRSTARHLRRVALRPGDDDPHIMPSSYDEAIWVPKPDSETAETVKAIHVCYPVLTGVAFGVFGEGSRTPNDILFRISDLNGNTNKYLLNNKLGIVGYDDGDTLLFEPPQDDSERPDVFTVLQPSATVPSIEADTLSRMLLRDSEMIEH